MPDASTHRLVATSTATPSWLPAGRHAEQSGRHDADSAQNTPSPAALHASPLAAVHTPSRGAGTREGHDAQPSAEHADVAPHSSCIAATHPAAPLTHCHPTASRVGFPGHCAQSATHIGPDAVVGQ